MANMANRSGVLLVGGNGFYGLALANALARKGREVHVLSRSTPTGTRDGVTFHQGSQDDAGVVVPLLIRCGTLIHLASTTTPGLSAGRSSVDAIENLLPAASLMEIMATRAPKHLVFVSTGGAIYGNPDHLPVNETHPAHPLSSHAAGKLALEAFFTSFAHCSGIPLTILRPANLYGPGQTFRGGFGLIRTVLERTLHSEPFELWGDGSTIRDYLYIDDVVEATLSLLDNDVLEGTFNLGTGIGTSIDDLLAMVRKVTGRNLKIVRKPARDVDVSAVYLDCTRVQMLCGWAPRVDLERGLHHTWQWRSQFPL